MPTLTQNFNGTFAMRRLGTTLDPFIPVSESRQIEFNRLSLTEIPDSFNRVIVTSDDDKLWYELPIGIPTENQYVVDYNEGFIDFHSSNDGLTVNCQYLGTGWHFISASRVIVGSSSIDTAETLQNLADTTIQARDDAIQTDTDIQATESIRISNEIIRQNTYNTSLMNWLEPVATYNDIATTYINPLLGDCVQTEDTNLNYRYDGNNWAYFQKINVSGFANQAAFSTHLIDSTKLGKYVQHRIPAKNYFTFLNKNLSIVSCFGDSITYGYGMLDNFKSYPTQLMQLINNNNDLTHITEADDTIEYYSTTNQMLGIGVTYDSGTDEYILTSGSTEVSPRYVIDWIVIDTTSNYKYSFQLETINSNDFQIKARLYAADSSNVQIGDEDLSISLVNSDGIYKTFDIYINTILLLERHDGATKFRLGIRLDADTNINIVKVKESSLKKTTELFDSFSLNTSNVSFIDNAYVLNATVEEFNPRFVTGYIANKYPYVNKKYLFDLEFDVSNCLNRKIDPRIILYNSSNVQLDEVNTASFVEVSTTVNKVTFIADLNYYNINKPTFDRFVFGVRLNNAVNGESLKVTKISFKEVDKGIFVANRGISGETTADGINRISTIIADHPDICIIAFGTNDIRNGVTLSTYLVNLTTIINTLKNNNIIPILATLPPLAIDQTNYDLVDDWNIEIKYLATTLGVQVHDRYWALNDGDLSYIADGRHPTEEGYSMLANTVYDILTGTRID